jgi:5-methylcytosine-specific restriction endonuclease McrA
MPASVHGVRRHQVVVVGEGGPWARRAVFFRERRLCAICRTDRSPHRTPHSMRRYYDHIVPLAAGGLNDITNFQPLCRACNLAKSADRLLPSADYRRWYGM